MSVSLLILHDNAPIRRNMIRLLSAEKNISVTSVHSFDTAPDDILIFEVLIVPSQLAGEDSYAYIKSTLAIHPNLKVIVITVDEKSAMLAIAAGAAVILSYSLLEPNLLEVVRNVVVESLPIDAGRARAIVRTFAKLEKPLEGVLSDKETEVLALLAKGFNYADTAQAVQSSINTIRTHVRHIYSKLGVHSKSEAVFMAGLDGQRTDRELAIYLLNTLLKYSEAVMLTEKESELLYLLAKGLSYESAAESMNISINTIRSHTRRIYQKLQVHSSSEAVYEAMRSGLLD